MDSPQPEREHRLPAAPPPAGFQADKLSTYLLRFLNRLKSSGKSSHTISAYRNDLNLFSEFLLEKGFDPRSHGVNLQEEWDHFLHANGRNSPASVRRAFMSVRTFLHFLISEGYIDGSPLLEVKSPKQPSHDLMRCLPAQFRSLANELHKRAGEGDEKAVRDLALVLVLGLCGLKASEAAQVCWADVMTGGEGEGGTLRVPGAGERLVPLSRDTRDALVALKDLRARLDLDDGPRSKLFFGYLNVSRRTRTPSLHRHGIKFVVYETCEEILRIPYNSESLRNHAILRWLDQGLTAQRVADLAGYSSLHSLERFARADKALRKPRRKLQKTAEGT
ncbi:MAG: site-specific integrase [Silvanigrellales bacterium]|jgi:site-specific recombinase XerD|nr:site-specific integrase [Silvanigrellales bacterium]